MEIHRSKCVRTLFLGKWDFVSRDLIVQQECAKGVRTKSLVVFFNGKSLISS